jgi:hypothetical protein
MTDVTIRVENLRKQYRIGGHQARYKKTIRESLRETVQAPLLVSGQAAARTGLRRGGDRRDHLVAEGGLL